jgi:hypothetical protein
VELPDAGGWQFYGPQNGGPRNVYGVTSDPGGNVWVAGGEDGLFLLKPGANQFRQYAMADGLRPFGYMPNGGTPPGTPFAKVISVTGGPVNTVFVGYEGKPPAPGQFDCDSNWFYPRPDPSIYKSGDADRVTLQPNDKISVVHYDIFTGPGQIPEEPEGREKLCTIRRMAYHAGTHSIWFGANHGFAWGDANFAGPGPTCSGPDYGKYICTGIYEHSHPAINGFADEARTSIILLTGEYYGMSADNAGDVWIGGGIRSAKFRYATVHSGGPPDYFAAGAEMECNTQQCIARRIDVWPDKVGEPDIPRPSDRVANGFPSWCTVTSCPSDDDVSDMAAMPDGSVWIGSFSLGLAHYIPGQATVYRNDKIVEPRNGRVAGLERDPKDGSLWIGYTYGGLARLKDNDIYVPYDSRVLGNDLTQGPILDIQSDNFGNRRILVAFLGGGGKSGALGIYAGD